MSDKMNMAAAMAALRAKQATTAPVTKPTNPAPEPVPAHAQPAGFSFGALLAPKQPAAPTGLPTPPAGLAALAQQAAKQAVQAAALPPAKPKEPFVASYNPQLEEAKPELQAAVTALAEALHNEVPGIGGFLQEIQVAVRSEPELLHLLNDEQIDSLYQGLIRESGIQIAPNAQKRAKAATKKAAKVEVSDDDM